MRIRSEIDKNVFLGEIRDNAFAQGMAEGRAEGRAELESKFGPMPKWAEVRVKKATAAQNYRWTMKVLNAKSLEAVIGKR